VCVCVPYVVCDVWCVGCVCVSCECVCVCVCVCVSNVVGFLFQWNESRTGLINTGWQRPIGCLKLQVIFRNRASVLVIGFFCKKNPAKIWHPVGLRHSVAIVNHSTGYRALLRKMTYTDMAYCGSSPLCGYR